MTISVVLKLLSDLEQSAADLYGWYAEVFATTPKAGDFFTRMKKQELRHRDIVDFQRRLVMADSTQFDDVPIEVDQIRETIAQVEKHISEGIFELGDAIEFALLFEKGLAETHYKTAATLSNPDIAKLVKSLTDGDEDHITLLKEFARKTTG